MDIKTRVHQSRSEIFDIVRKQWVALTPEENVRQFMIHKLANLYKVPLCRIAVERQIIVNGVQKRFDMAIFNPNGTLKMVVECKAPNVPLSELVLSQVLNYNTTLDAQFIMITNGAEELVFSPIFNSKKIEKISLENAIKSNDFIID